jgi:predicted metal-binding membrane protein
VGFALDLQAWRAIPRRDRVAVLCSLFGVAVLAWIYLIRASARMGGDGAPMEMMEIRPWDLADFGLIFIMWTIMMVGMMLPSAAPATMMYAAVTRKAARDGNVVPPTMVFVSGYVALWTLFSVLATSAQWGLDRAALLSPMMVTTSPAVGASLLVAAGVYQLTPIKRACLDHCRSPAHFLAGHWRPGVAGAFRMGLEHGAFCVGCCWVLMGLLFLGGVMNLLWIAAISAFVFMEKVLPVSGAKTSERLTGWAMIVIGAALWLALAGPLL